MSRLIWDLIDCRCYEDRLPRFLEINDLSFKWSMKVIILEQVNKKRIEYSLMRENHY